MLNFYSRLRFSYVRVGKSILAHLIRNSVWQQGGGYSFDAVHYDHTDSSGMSQRKTRSAPETVLGVPFYGSEYTDPRHAEFDAGGTNVGLVNPNTPIYETPYPGLPPIEDTSPLWINGQRVTATLDGMAISWQMVSNLINSGLIGGEIGLIEILGRQTAPRFVGYSAGGRWFGSNLNGAITEAIETNTWRAYANYYVSDSSWFGFGLLPLGQRQSGGKPKLAGVGFTDSQFKQLSEQVYFMRDSKECVAAFKAAGLTPVNEMIENGGLTILHAKLLTSSTNDSIWGGNSELREGMNAEYSKRLRVNDVTPVGSQNGRYFSSLNNRAFSGADGPVTEIIIHSLAHAGGAPGSYAPITRTQRNPSSRVGMLTIPESYQTISRTPNHDLEWLNYLYNNEDKQNYIGKYDEIIKACTPKN